MNKRYQIGGIVVLLSVWIFMSCSSARRMSGDISVVPGRQVLSPDSVGLVEMNVIFKVPRDYMSKRNRLFITPQVFVNNEFRAELEPLVVDAPIYMKKLERRLAIDNFQDIYGEYRRSVENTSSSFELEYRTRFRVPGEAETGFIRAVVSQDGCGECSGLDTLYLAGISNLTDLIDPKEELELTWMEPEFVVRPKIREGKGEALLHFVINRYDINLDLGNNREELERMTNTLKPVLTDSLATLRGMNIYGMASADGPYGFNSRLARDRAAAAKQWLVKKLGIGAEVRELIQVDSRPEGWWPVYRAMVVDGHPDSLSVKEILTTYTKGNDDVQEAYIRRLSCWPDIRSKYLSKDRKVEYAYSYVIRSFTTDEELKTMYRVRPDAFNEDELLRVASLATNDTAKTEIYRTLMKYFPESTVAANNLSVLYLRSGQVEEAKKTLQRQKEYSPETLATLAACYVYANDFERAIELLRDVELPEARYNLGLLKARQRKLDEAYALLKDYRDLNTAIVALSVGRTDEAQGIMNEFKDVTPLAEYVRALIAARTGNEAMFRLHIGNACKDESLRERASGEPDFERFRENWSPEIKE